MNAAGFYDQYWQSGKHISPEWDRKRFQDVFGPLIGRERVLDYGCGMGHAYQRQLARAVNSYVGADVGPVALSDCLAKGFRALQISEGTSAIDSPDASFDGATCIEVMEHLFDPLMAARELHRVLKPGGVVIATVPNFGYHTWRLNALLRARVPSEPEDPKANRFNGVHIRFFNATLFRQLFEQAGFREVKITSFDRSSVWDVFTVMGPLSRVSRLSKHFPAFMHLDLLKNIWPSLFAYRIRVVAVKG